MNNPLPRTKLQDRDIYRAFDELIYKAITNVGVFPASSTADGQFGDYVWSDGVLAIHDGTVWRFIKGSTLITGKPDVTKTTITSAYTVLNSDDVIFCSGTFTLSLLDASDAVGYYKIYNVGSGEITVDPHGSQTINGDLTFKMYQNESIDLISDGDNWHV